mmetsp:Transcript_15599/g.30185  ORF Transcript_15599/g.30185 Transcript_15599/m.30185 type:complete len:509 (+) Transcript_15599:106-1632(+)|eukprot:CAMPEP_0171502042 /NCGR_PEP_ID=MMETSP0958-20121227/9931_1 /TAXON_ID=87120 /ORGANISM="Aurantiochytrium limacinum, Strain ATCCMYA-1381" /LENGTH=508 /DNA_ID=CAMNT_0012036999 /DNA_START=312 /DNA_END=1838 /DNA_ORIENTATION=-
MRALGHPFQLRSGGRWAGKCGGQKLNALKAATSLARPLGARPSSSSAAHAQNKICINDLSTAEMRLADSVLTGGYLHSAYFWLSVVGMGATDAMVNAALKSHMLARAWATQGKVGDDLLKLVFANTVTRFAALVTSMTEKLKLRNPMRLNKGAQRLAELQQAHRWYREGVESRVLIEGPMLFKLDRLMQFSAAAYGWKTLQFLGLGRPGMTSNRRGIQLLTGIDRNDIVFVQEKSRLFRPGHYVCIDHATQSIVVTIRGTMRLQDVVTDLCCEETPFSIIDDDGKTLSGSVHSGFLLAAENIQAEVQHVVEAALQDNPGYKVQVTGHSLGGACATLLAFLWTKDPRLAKTQIEAVSFAAPCCVSHEIARSQFVKSRVSSFVLGDDLVCRLSLVSLEGFLRTCDELASLTDDACPESGKTILERIRAECQSRTDRLFPAGRVFHLPLQCRYHPTRYDVYMAEEVDPALSMSDIVLTPKMFNVHLPSRYLNALRRQRIIHLHASSEGSLA